MYTHRSEFQRIFGGEIDEINSIRSPLISLAEKVAAEDTDGSLFGELDDPNERNTVLRVTKITAIQFKIESSKQGMDPGIKEALDLMKVFAYSLGAVCKKYQHLLEGVESPESDTPPS